MRLFSRCTVQGTRSMQQDSVYTASIAVAAAIAQRSRDHCPDVARDSPIQAISATSRCDQNWDLHSSVGFRSADSLELGSLRLAQRSRERSRSRRALRRRQRSRDSYDTLVIAIRSEQQELRFRRISHLLRTISPAPVRSHREINRQRSSASLRSSPGPELSYDTPCDSLGSISHARGVR